MADKVGDAFVELTTQDAKFKQGLNGAKKDLKSFSDEGSMQGKLIGGAIGAGIVVGINESLATFAIDERSTARLNAVLKATGYAAGFSSKELQQEASALQNLTGVGDEVISQTQAILLTFKQIKGDEFKDATILAMDMAEVLGQDAKQGAIQLGKALNDPIKGVTALSRVGVSFTKSQKEQIRVATQAGNLMKAQAVILDELKAEFGGAAEAAGDTYGGSLDKVKAAQGDVKEGIGELIAEFLSLKETNELVATSLGGIATKLKDLANSPDTIAFSERLQASMFETITVVAHHIESLGMIIGRGLANILGKTDSTVDELVAQRAEELAKKQELIQETFRKRLAKRLGDNTDKIIEEEEKGAGAVVEAENKKKAARDTTLNSFADIIKEAQKASSAGIAAGGFGAGGGEAGANPPDTTTADKLTTTGDSNTAILQDLLTQAKLMVTGINKMTVFG